MAAGKFFFFIHGMAHATDFFFPWLRHELEGRGCRTLAPEFKDAWDPDYADWKSTFERELATSWNKKDDLVLLGHSLGGFFVLRLLGDSAGAPWTKKLVAIILISSTALTQPKRKKFYAEPITWENVRRCPIRVITVYSNDDRNVERAHQDLIVQELKSMPEFEFREFMGFKHFMMPEAPPIAEAAFALL
jgi:predicted alpha/beta hydrolase family esterase